MCLPDFEAALVESCYQQVVPQRRPSQQPSAGHPRAQPCAVPQCVRHCHGMQHAMARAPHHTRVAMSHTANALSCGEPAARNWPHGLQHKACGGAKRVTQCARCSHHSQSLTVTDCLMFPCCSVVRLHDEGAARPRMPAQVLQQRSNKRQDQTACRERIVVSPTASAGAETESQVHKHTPPACASARKFLAIGL